MQHTASLLNQILHYDVQAGEAASVSVWADVLQQVHAPVTPTLPDARRRVYIYIYIRTAVRQQWILLGAQSKLVAGHGVATLASAPLD